MRAVLFLPASLLVSLLLFLLMAHLAGVGRSEPPETQDYTSVNLHRLKLDSDVRVREREALPPPELQPEQPPAPTPPDMSQPVNINTPSVALNMQTPALEIGMQINASVDLSSVSAVAPAPSPAPVPSPGIKMHANATPVSRMNPQYPRRALTRRIQGYVVAEFTVDTQGRVIPDSFKIVEADPPGMFDRAVERALMRWRFNPLTENGAAVPFRTRQRLEFKLE
ncbi:energy transducer TonB [Marinobacterium stanieri]|uniref:Protein TonB n=1 Tax=Marinobacterium stanieri TaxID=49186 RepID=A0A1N6P8A1_9GAMM|nr:energy transducer TonB [Marinobacterium stanieri]SIQ00555.1 outer membrane transport energization protein TonB [Marinobacterium stanieri]